MTWRELAEQINNLSEEQKDTDVTIYDSAKDEFFGSYYGCLGIALDEDVLDDGHPYLRIDPEGD